MNPVSRRRFLALASAAAAGATAGCAGMGGSGGVKSGSGPITFWSCHPGTSTAVERELINRFQRRFPDLPVKLIDAGKDYEEVVQKFNAALIGTDVPDVVLLDDIWWFHFALSGVITPLEDLFDEVGLDTSDYVDSLLADYEFNGRHYALPYARSTPLFYYNKAVWDRVGLPDRGPQTWQEFDEWGPQLQRAVTAGNWAHGWANDTLISWTFQGPNWTFGGAYSDEWTLKFTDPATIAAGNYYRDSIHRKGYAAIANDINNEFATGIVASALASTGALVGITAAARFNFGVSPLPTGPGGAPGCPTGGQGWRFPPSYPTNEKSTRSSSSHSSPMRPTPRISVSAPAICPSESPPSTTRASSNTWRQTPAREWRWTSFHTPARKITRAFSCPAVTASSRPAWNPLG
ncbi:bacterial extracellular solute-binding family protein [Mycobacterium kansasii]|uniref:Bacterial extracellular solute-binding family protein n=1 Tax=Mycobacterium kansasii TaxID=1768 RepID=A0A1V3XTS6_MYCKA|nr:bacterial extracellular solute-binding family protein [Mycobacterium kansasii]